MGSISFKPTNFVDEPKKPELVYSIQQQAAIDFIKQGKGNALITAVAGAGKTSTLLAMLPHMNGYVSVVCFSKPIQLEIEEKVRADGYGPKVRTGTFHSFGSGAWRRVAPDVKKDGLGPKEAGYWKYDRIFDIMDGIEKFQDFDPTPIPFEYRHFVKKLCGLAKQYAIGTASYPLEDIYQWEDLIEHFDLDEMFAKDGYDQQIEVEEMVVKGIDFSMQALRISIRLAREVIDFDDMVYMPLFTECRMFQVDYLLVDEAQDLNRSRRMLARKMLSPYRGRLVAVGDDRQAIYGFSGAESESFNMIAEEFNCTHLPLTVTFRCPSKVVDLAKTWVSHIEAKPGANPGEVQRISLEKFWQMDLLDTDVILCRYNAPLVAMAYALIRKGVPCFVEGRDIGEGILELASRWKVVHLSALASKVQAWQFREVTKLLEKGHDAQADVIDDKANTLLALIDGMPKESTLIDLQQRVRTMFQDTNGGKRQILKLSSVHKAKGREWPRVFLLGRNAFMPSKHARQDWHKVQEDNLQYVAVTRALETFIDIDVPAKKFDFKKLPVKKEVSGVVNS